MQNKRIDNIPVLAMGQHDNPIGRGRLVDGLLIIDLDPRAWEEFIHKDVETLQSLSIGYSGVLRKEPDMSDANTQDALKAVREQASVVEESNG